MANTHTNTYTHTHTHTHTKTKSCLIECEGLYTDVTKTTWAEMIVIGGVLSKYDKSENNNMDEMHTPCEKKNCSWMAFQIYKI